MIIGQGYQKEVDSEYELSIVKIDSDNESSMEVTSGEKFLTSDDEEPTSIFDENE